jgi:hypothetical protein
LQPLESRLALVELGFALFELRDPLLLFGTSLLLLAEDAATFAGRLLLELATVSLQLANLIGEFRFALSKFGFRFVEIAAAGGELGGLRLQLVHAFFGDAKPFEPL